MSRVVFEDVRRIPAAEPDRTDVAVFAGLVRVNPGAMLSDAHVTWLKDAGWVTTPDIDRDISKLPDFPLVFENFTAFANVFDQGGAELSFGTDYLAAAVRSFFTQGGRRCYVIRMGDPFTPRSTDADRKAVEAMIVPRDASAQNRASWHGAAHLWGLPDASFLLIPDLPLFYANSLVLSPGEQVDFSSGPEQFVVCTEADLTPPDARIFPSPAPRLSMSGYKDWAATVRKITALLRDGRLREVQFIAALPLPFRPDAQTSGDYPASVTFASDLRQLMAALLPEDHDPANGASSAFLQLAYPWLRTNSSGSLLESLEAPDGTLAGVIARNALTRGAYTSATRTVPTALIDLHPELPQYETVVPDTLTWGTGTAKPLITRVSLFGFKPDGIRLLSDVTAYPGESYRPARINRLVSIISRAARRLGDDSVFGNSGPKLWAHLQSVLREVMLRLWRVNALDGDTPADAFTVRCDRSTMTQNDVDAGRLIAEVTFSAAAIIELIRVTLALEPGGVAAVENNSTVAGVS